MYKYKKYHVIPEDDLWPDPKNDSIGKLLSENRLFSAIREDLLPLFEIEGYYIFNSSASKTAGAKADFKDLASVLIPDIADINPFLSITPSNFLPSGLPSLSNFLEADAPARVSPDFDFNLSAKPSFLTISLVKPSPVLRECSIS